MAEQFKVGEKKYPDYLRYQFGIGFPNEKLDKLEKESYIRSTTAAETLPRLKIAELKTIASQFDLKVSGKKLTFVTELPKMYRKPIWIES